MTVVVREYQPDAPAGLIGEWLDARGIDWRVSRPGQAPGPERADAIVALGSSMSAYWREPAWIAGECALLARQADAGTPVLGICFGAQVLARALGGRVAPAETPEIGWVRPDSDQHQLQGPYLTWHFDAITLPPGAEALASTPHALQAFAWGRAMGLQFHPEVTPAIWRDWGEQDPDTLTDHVRDPAGLAAEIAGSTQATRERAFGLLDWWWAWLARGTDASATGGPESASP
jgi:GMP synthase-like glutamine amidotransferase